MHYFPAISTAIQRELIAIYRLFEKPKTFRRFSKHRRKPASISIPYDKGLTDRSPTTIMLTKDLLRAWIGFTVN